MISIVICSVNKDLLSNLEKNIAETIGLPYELIAIDNSVNQYGICKVYNEGGKKAKFPILCFMHEDILFETKKWGELVCKHLADNTTGLLGIAGGDIKSRVPSSWSQPIISTEVNIIQHYKSRQKSPEHLLVTNASINGTIKKVVLLDGVWLCTKKEVFDQYTFDEIMFTGFHGYDIDYSLQVNTKYNLYVVFDILIHHYSEGNPDKNWVNSAVLINKKWMARLPVSSYVLSGRQYSFHHWHSLRVFLQQLVRLNYNNYTILKYYILYSFTRYFSIRRFLSLGKYVLISISAGRAGSQKS